MISIFCIYCDLRNKSACPNTILLNIITICVCSLAIINWNFTWNIDLNNGVYCVSVWTRYNVHANLMYPTVFLDLLTFPLTNFNIRKKLRTKTRNREEKKNMRILCACVCVCNFRILRNLVRILFLFLRKKSFVHIHTHNLRFLEIKIKN